MNPELRTPRLGLRDALPTDLDALVALDADPGVKRYIDDDAPVDRDEVADMLQWWLGCHDRTPGYGFWMAVDRATGAFVGWFHLRPGVGRGADEPELGYRLHRAWWGRGLATEGAERLLDHAFRTQGAALVYAETMAVNLGSRRVLEKVGMRLVREFRADWPVRVRGDEHGDVEYEISRRDWERTRVQRDPADEPS